MISESTVSDLCLAVSETRFARITPKEADGSAYFGWIAMTLVSIALCARIYADRIHLMVGFRILFATITGKPRNTFRQMMYESSGKGELKGSHGRPHRM